MTVEMELNLWEGEFVADLAKCMAPLEGEEPANSDDKDAEEEIEPLKLLYESCSNRLSRTGKEGIKEAERIAKVPVRGIAERHERQMDKYSRKFEAIQEEMIDILTKWKRK